MNPSFLDRWQPQLLSVLRIVSGLLFLEHGTVKLFDFPAPAPHLPPSLVAFVTIAGIIELVGGALVTVGVFTRWAALVMSGEMAVGYWLIHFSAMGQHFEFWPIVNGGAEAILFCFVFLYLAAAGPGPWAFDKKN